MCVQFYHQYYGFGCEHRLPAGTVPCDKLRHDKTARPSSSFKNFWCLFINKKTKGSSARCPYIRKEYIKVCDRCPACDEEDQRRRAVDRDYLRRGKQQVYNSYPGHEAYQAKLAAQSSSKQTVRKQGRHEVAPQLTATVFPPPRAVDTARQANKTFTQAKKLDRQRQKDNIKPSRGYDKVREKAISRAQGQQQPLQRIPSQRGDPADYARRPLPPIPSKPKQAQHHQHQISLPQRPSPTYYVPARQVPILHHHHQAQDATSANTRRHQHQHQQPSYLSRSMMHGQSRSISAPMDARRVVDQHGRAFDPNAVPKPLNLPQRRR